MQTVSLFFVLSAFSLGFSAAAPIAAPDSSSFAGTLTGANGSPLTFGSQGTNDGSGIAGASPSSSSFGGSGASPSAPISYYGAGSGGFPSSAGNENSNAVGPFDTTSSDVSNAQMSDGGVPSGDTGVSADTATSNGKSSQSELSPGEKAGMGIAAVGGLASGYGLHKVGSKLANRNRAPTAETAPLEGNGEGGAYRGVIEEHEKRNDAPAYDEISSEKSSVFGDDVLDGAKKIGMK